jgi:regulation of enolase protein 1 (concanavalin A-like superfamily)
MTLQITTIPTTLEWKNHPVSFQIASSDAISIGSGRRTDWFIDPQDSSWNCDNAPCALFTPPDDEFLFSAKVHVPFASTFDAGVIQLRMNETLWGKLCFEYSPQGKPMIVSVVTRGKSDDCNSTVIDGNEVYLRVAVRPKSIAFHYSADGRYWNLVRLFTLGDHKGIRAGLSAQSPTGEGCAVAFSEIRYRAGTIADNRNGE